MGGTCSKPFSTVDLIGFLLQKSAISRIFAFSGVAEELFIHRVVALLRYVTFDSCSVYPDRHPRADARHTADIFPIGRGTSEAASQLKRGCRWSR